MSNPRAETLLAALLAIVEASNHAEDCEGENECNMLTIAEKAIAADGVMSHQARAMPAATAGEALSDAQDIMERTAELMQRHGETLEKFYERTAIATRTWAYQWQRKHLDEDNGYQSYAALRPAAAAQQS